MKVKDTFVLQQIGEDFMVIPALEGLTDFGAMITLNETGALLWEGLTSETNIKTLSSIIQKEYGIDEKTATEDVLEFVALLKSKNLLEE